MPAAVKGRESRVESRELRVKGRKSKVKSRESREWLVREYGKKGRKARNWEEKACFLRKKHKKGQKNLVVSQKSITFAASFWKEV